MTHLYEETERHVVGVQPVPYSEVNKYGILVPGLAEGRVHTAAGLVEKPAPQEAPSNMAVMGRYILNPSIFEVLETIAPGAGGEYQLTDALHAACNEDGLLALELAGDRYDIGDKFGYMKAILKIGLRRQELSPMLLDYLHELVSRPEYARMSASGAGAIRQSGD